jgi:hypothetical protein
MFVDKLQVEGLRVCYLHLVFSALYNFISRCPQTPSLRHPAKFEHWRIIYEYPAQYQN